MPKRHEDSACPSRPPILEDANLAGSRFHDVNLRDSEFRDVCLSGARIVDADLRNRSIEDADIDGMTIHGHDVAALIRDRNASVLRSDGPTAPCGVDASVDSTAAGRGTLR